MQPESTQHRSEQSGQPAETFEHAFESFTHILPRRNFLKMAALGGTALAASQLTQLTAFAGPGKVDGKACPKPSDKNHACARKDYAPITPVTAKNYDALVASVEGLSKSQLEQHIGLYNGYVKKINAIEEKLHAPDSYQREDFRGLHLDQTYALNGVVLHEYYFDNLAAGHTPGELTKEIFAQEFGSWEGYVANLKAVGKAARGWAITALSHRDGRVHNYALDLHDAGVPVHTTPLLVLDVYEHAYMIDFGTNRGSYLDVFMNNTQWDVVEKRLKHALHHCCVKPQ